MIIDFHAHVFPEKIASSTISKLQALGGGNAYTDGTTNGLIEALVRAQADVAISLPVLTKPTQFDSVLNFALEVNEKYKDCNRKIISFAGMHPDCENIREKMRKVKDVGLKGVKIHPDYQSTYIDDQGYVEILKCAKDYDLIVVTHSGVDDGYKDQPVKCPPELVKKVIDKVKHEKFVLGHYGGHKQWDKVYDILAGENVYFDTAFTLHEIDKELFIKILSKHGEDKVLFATDCPWRDIKDDIAILNSYDLEKRTLDKLYYKNALKLLGLGEGYEL